MDWGHSQHGQEVWALLAMREPGFFLEFGAMDGIGISNTLAMERAGWDGICAEPNPEEFRELKRNRLCQCFEVAIAGRRQESANFMVSPRRGQSGLPCHFTDHHNRGRMEALMIKVQTWTLNELLEEAQAPRVIDFASIDTEGSELEILEAFDFSTVFRTLCVEHNAVQPRRRQIRRLLGSKGYRLTAEAGLDDCFVKA